MGHPLAYPALVTIGTLAITLAWVPFADPEQAAVLYTVALIMLGYSGFQAALAFGYLPAGLPAAKVGSPDTGVSPAREMAVRRVRQQHRLVSRSWLEFTIGGKNCWLPVFFEPSLLSMTQDTAELSGRAIHIDGERLYPSGRIRNSEPVGKLIDNPSRPDPAAITRSGHGRHLLLDAQSAIAAPLIGLMWVYVGGGGPTAFAAATVVAASAAVWLAAIRGSDPS